MPALRAAEYGMKIARLALRRAQDVASYVDRSPLTVCYILFTDHWYFQRREMVEIQIDRFPSVWGAGVASASHANPA